MVAKCHDADRRITAMSHTPSIPPSNPQFPGTGGAPGGPGGPGTPYRPSRRPVAGSSPWGSR
ncbi:hypothetical protein StrepF001_28280 [Streptomyces sp. F001]|nr:hypothetical protein StrepF001_28280 [Streptomyces sp. F001]